jgi:cation transport ATPase
MMGLLGNILGKGAGDLIESIGNVVDKFVTTDAEKEQAKKELQEVIFNHEVGLEQELTKRQQADMASDSWLSKNVRPLALMFLTVMTMILAYLTIFFLPAEKTALLKPWLDMLTTLLSLVYTFYFGSRGFEKITSMIANNSNKKNNEQKTERNR